MSTRMLVWVKGSDERAELSRRQAECIVALLDGLPSYGEVADKLGVHVGTVHRHLGRVREAHPEFYAAVMAVRRRALDQYHLEAVERARKRSLAWGRRRYAARYRAAHGRWPWEAFG